MRTQNEATEKTLKAQIVKLSKEVKCLRNKVQRQKKRADFWRNRYYSTRKSTKLRPVLHHSYPMEIIWLSVCMHIDNNISLRAVSKTVTLLMELFGMPSKRPSASTIRNWCLKFGLWCLQRPIPSGEYVIISDESVEMNQEKLLLSLLVPVSEVSYCKPLCMQDVRILGIGVQKSWKSSDLVKIIKGTHEQNITISYAVSDAGGILKRAFADSEITWVEDATHKIANCIKHIFCKNERFNDFIKQMNSLRAKWICSQYNLYIPPALRGKARFHQVLTVYKWATFILDNWTEIPEQARELLSFLQVHLYQIHVMKALHELSVTFAHIFKSKGIQVQSIALWQEYLSHYQSYKVLSAEETYFITQMNEYLAQVEAKLSTDTQVLCCSDVIESIFGKYKNKGGAKIITEDVLKIAAYPKIKNIEEIRQAIQETKIKDVLLWKKENIMASKLSKIKAMKAKKAA